MKIVVIAPFAMYQNFSASFIHNQMKAVVNKGNKVMVLVPVAFFKKDIYGKRFGKPITTVVQDGVDVKYIRYFSLSSFGKKSFNPISALICIRLFCMKVIKDYSPDIIWAHTFDFGCIIGEALKKKLGIPLMLTTHGGDTEVFIRNSKNDSLLVDNVDWIICVSKKLQKQLNEIGIQKVSCIENGFCIERLKTRDKDTHRIIQVGHLIKSKHFDTTIKALEVLDKNGYEMSFDIVGQGPEEAELRNQVNDRGLNNYVRFHGQLPNETVIEMMAGSRYFVMPSYPEGLGIVYLEAMGSRCVTIGTKGEGIEGIIVDKLNGFLVEKEDYNEIVDVIEQCENDESFANKLAENAFNSVKQYSWDYNAERNLEVLKKIINCTVWLEEK